MIETEESTVFDIILHWLNYNDWSNGFEISDISKTLDIFAAEQNEPFIDDYRKVFQTLLHCIYAVEI